MMASTSPRPLIVHSLADAKAALAVAADLGIAVTLRSAPGAAAYLGAPVFREIIAEARRNYPGVAVTAVLDCGRDPGLALNALRQGIKVVRVEVAEDVRRRLADIAGQQGAALDEDPRPGLDLFGIGDAGAACRAWLAHGRTGGG